MFEQHPVPQNISSYQFHLVGDMTLKQFLELAAGVVIGVLIYATSLPGLIKWPLILFSAGFGAAIAFVPFEERPLERWIFAFFRSVYSPTLFYWQKVTGGVKYFQDETINPDASGTQEEKSKAKPSPFAKIPFLAKLEDTETMYLNKISELFTPQVAATAPAGQPVATPLAPVTQISQPQVPVINVDHSTPIGEILSAQVQMPHNGSVQTASEERRTLHVPETTFVTVDKNSRPGFVVEEVTQPVDLQKTEVGQTLTGQVIQNIQAAQFSTDAAPPSIPTIVNTVSGQVMDHEGKIIEGAILEIRDESGRPVRALKTNRAGHFLIVTALANGKYNIVVEKEGSEFDPISFEASGQIISPIAIKAK